MYDAFISYSRRNSRFMDRLVADLKDHGLEIWYDTIELNVGDSTHKSIEDGIEQSRFFCLAISPASLKSYYVREIEFEQAFTRMVEERRRSYILPLVIQKTDTPIPRRIKHLYRLDFVNRKNYSRNMRTLARTIRGSEGYSGARWFKGLNISNLGEPVGVGPTSQRASLGVSYHIRWVVGVVERVDVYNNGKLVHYKEFEYDSEGRVIVNKMFSPDPAGEWSLQDDVWYYAYDPKSGVRSTKTMRCLGEATARVVSYNEDGDPTREVIVTEPGHAQDRSFPYARKVFDYDEDGNPLGERWFDTAGNQISSS